MTVEEELSVAKYATQVERAKMLGCIRCEKSYARYFDMVVIRNHPLDKAEVLGVICPSCKVPILCKIDHE